ncbi:competence/damage-inducible protein A [Hathewaya histolytica]|uniref:Putative competence-damage inducible protein n=1 Tax=Hathewaya histolytica TaxID=1498 RepID=A0A4U9S3I7_HATHI|nr:competence/damage-inducible protein A [Hathewaya histolytica]VTQ96230.1 competence damage-inducible protein A [Hathewaya histolytica]
MKAEILCVGTEILLGDILNTNAQYLSKRLAEIGIDVYHETVVGDNPKRLEEAYKIAFNRADIVISTGGLGPTKDDLTKEIGSKFFNKALVLHEESMKKLEEHFSKTKRVMSENNKKQAYTPEGSIVLPNNNGTAPGCIIEDGKKILVLMPGPPREMKGMFEEGVVPYLQSISKEVLYSKVLRVLGVGESSAEYMISDIIENQTNPTIAPYAKEGEMIFRITAKATNEEKARELIVPMEKAVRDVLGDNIYGEGETSIEEVVSKLLLDRQLTLAIAESCTGGMVASKIAECAGISKVFKEGLVTYTEEAKEKRLGVKRETLDKYGVVSAEVAKEMAEGVAKTSGTDIGISTTGVAGPGGGSEEKPVGLVYIAIYYRSKCISKELNLNGNRNVIRNRASMALLDFLRRELQK